MIKSGGWAENRYGIDNEKEGSKSSGGGWASNFKSPFSGSRFGKSDGWASNFQSPFSKNRFSKSDGWASNFQSPFSKNRFSKSDSWASNFKSPFSKNRFSKSDGWAANFKPNYNFDKDCKNKGWNIDFRSDLSGDRYNAFNSGFFVLQRPKYEPLKFSDSFSSSGKSKEGGYIYNKKNKTVKEKTKFRFRSRPVTNDSFGPNVVKKEYKHNVYNKKKKRVTKHRGLFKRKREKEYKRKENMDLDLFNFKP